MEASQGRHKASKFAPEDLDIISRMPDNVVTNILDRLPLQYVTRTSILSRNWRFKWTRVSQLVFDENFYKYLSNTRGEKHYGRIIYTFLLHVKGDITKFFVYMGNPILDDDVSLWIFFLSQKGLKDLTIDKRGSRIKLPTHLFSCLELKHLKLVSCDFNPPASFHGFPNLVSLALNSVHLESGKYGELFTQCPKLELLELGCPFISGMVYFTKGKVKLVEIAKLVNLKILSLSLCNLDNMMITNVIFELVSFLPKLQELHLSFYKCKFKEDGGKKSLPSTLPCLKTLKLSEIDLGDKSLLSCAFETIKSFPDLHTLEITASFWDTVPTPATCSLDVDYASLGLLRLRSIVFTYRKCSENEVCLIKYLLACCPFLKKIVIRPFTGIGAEEKILFFRKLVKLHRASPVVDIDLF